MIFGLFRLSDMAQAVGEKRGAQLALIFGKFLPKGYQREILCRQEGAYARRRANRRIRPLRQERDDRLTGVPGVSVGLYQNGNVVFAGGFGVRELGKPAKVDAQTRYMIASNTKALVDADARPACRREENRLGHPVQ